MRFVFFFTVSLSDSVNAEVGSSVQSCKNHQFDFSELEWQTIGSLLPDDDDLFSSVVPDVDGSIIANYTGENEELDLFSSGGGLELENDPLDPSRGLKKSMDASLGNGSASGVGEHPYGEHPSRTLFVRNINSSVEDAELRVLFEVCVCKQSMIKDMPLLLLCDSDLSIVFTAIRGHSYFVHSLQASWFCHDILL